MAAITASMVAELRAKTDAPMMECKKALTEAEGNMEKAEELLRVKLGSKAGKAASRVTAEGVVSAAVDGTTGALVEINCETDFVGKDASFLKFTDNVAEVALKSGAADIDALKAAAYPGGGTVEEAAKSLIATIGEKIDVRRMARVENDGVIGSYIHGGRIGVLVALKGGSEDLAKGIAMHVAAMNPAHIRAEDVPADFLAKEKEIALAAMSDKEKNKPTDILEKIISGKVNKIVSEITLLGQATNVTVAEALKKEGADVASVVRLAVGEGIEKVEEDFAAEVMKQAGLR